MTENSYKEVTIGEKISHLQPLVGMPYEIKKLSENKQHYIYIERISIGDNRELFRKYILVVENGIVIDKYVIEETSPPIQLDFGS